MNMGSDMTSTAPDEQAASASGENRDEPDQGLAKFVSFYLGEKLYALYARAVAEVSHPLPITELPGSCDALCGISPLRGEIVALLDIRKLIGEPTRALQPKSKVLILRSGSRDDTSIGFEVDKVGEIVSLPINELKPATGPNDAFLFGIAETPEHTCMVVDHTKLASALA